MVVKLLTDLIKIYFRNSYSVFVREKNSTRIFRFLVIWNPWQSSPLFTTLIPDCFRLPVSVFVCFFFLSYRAKLISFPSRLHSRQKSQNALVQPLKKRIKDEKHCELLIRDLKQSARERRESHRLKDKFTFNVTIIRISWMPDCVYHLLQRHPLSYS